jgi:MoxR-like ATPase
VSVVSRRPVLVGRLVELATIRRLVDAASAESGGALIVTGEAGIGKTRLLDEAARRAANAGLVVQPYRAVLDRLLPPLGGETGRSSPTTWP